MQPPTPAVFAPPRPRSGRTWLALTLALTGWLTLTGFKARAERLLWHEVRLDASGQLLSWVPGDAPYDRVIRLAWEAFKQMPVQSNGYRTYFTHPVFYGPNDPGHPLYSGRWWVHNPASLFAMLTDSALLYHAYSGDRVVLDRVREMLDHSLARGRTRATDAWSLVPYACSDPGELTYRGANDTLYCFAENFTPCGRGDGIGFLEPDKVGELGHAYLLFHEATLDPKYLDAALHCADALARHVRPGGESVSPWPFRVDAITGTRIREDYTAHALGPIRLFDELLRLRLGRVHDYRRARDLAWRWLLAYPVRNQVWTQYFEDVLTYPDYRFNRNQYAALETARYLLQHPERDRHAREQARRIIDWVAGFFATDSVTMAGLPEKGRQWGAEVVSEQVNDMDKMSSHTARFASVLALWAEVTGDASARERAFRSFNWATYSTRTNGLVKTSIDEGTGYWFSDGYGDYMRHFQRGLASVPAWAPADADHLLGSTSVVREIHYDATDIRYVTYDNDAREVLRLRTPPAAIELDGRPIQPTRRLRANETGFTLEPLPGGGCVVRLHHRQSNRVRIVSGPAVSPSPLSTHE